MNQAKINHLISKLNYKVLPKARKLRNIDGPEGRLLKLRKTLTALIKYERIELNFQRADETRGYVDLLISEGLRYGPHDKKMMEMADYWILEKQYVPKLFEVLIPRYQNYNIPYTIIHNAPREYPGFGVKRSILELKGNPFPKIITESTNNYLLLQNILINEAKKQYKIQQFEKIVNKIST